MVDRLLASPQYGERWGRHWLDVARYSDDKLEGDVDNPYPNAFQYRDWVVRAFNQDMPYDTFVKAQIAGDMMEGAKEKDLAIGTGILWNRDPSSRTIAWMPQRAGSSRLPARARSATTINSIRFRRETTTQCRASFRARSGRSFALAPAEEVDAFKAQEKKVKELESRIQQFLHAQATQLAEILASQSPSIHRGGAQGNSDRKLRDVAEVASASKLDQETLARWVRYLKAVPVDNHYLDGWEKDTFDLEKFRKEALKVLDGAEEGGRGESHPKGRREGATGRQRECSRCRRSVSFCGAIFSSATSTGAYSSRKKTGSFTTVRTAAT